VLEVLAQLRANDDMARQMALNAQRFARAHLSRPARLCYYREVFSRMARLFK
jgi:hypothetical protein